MIPPVLVNISLLQNSKKIRLWLPVVLLWPVLILILIVIVPFAAIVEIILRKTGVRPLSLLVGLADVISSLRGTDISVIQNSSENNTFIKIAIM